MKKMMKRIGAILMAVAMMAALGVTGAWAADTYTISMDIESTDTHEYKVYQIYTGDLSDGTLSNVKYGNSGYGTAGAAVPDSELKGISGADAFAKSIIGSCTTVFGTLKAGADSLEAPAGYYLIVDDTTKQLVDGDAYSAYIVKVVNNVDIQPKKDTTSVDKKITTDTLGKDEATTTVNGKVDNVSIGDTVNYEITGTVPSHATDYDYYFYIIGDTLTEGLTFDDTSVVVKADGATLDEDEDYALYTAPNADGKTFQVALLDAKALAGKTITVTYSATLNEKAKIGELSNDNTVVIDYSNNPNHEYDGDKDNTKPGKPASESNSPLGETPESTTKTYTTGIEIMKVDEDGEVLTGAEFTISGDNEEIVLVSKETFVEDADGTYYALKDGTYTTEAPVTEDYMKQAEAGATAGYVVAENDYTGADVITVDGITYREYKEGDTGTVYILVKANASEYENDGKMYKKTIAFEQKNTNTAGVTASGMVDENGIVTFKGLGAGTYTITETKTPAGYNTIAPMELTIDFTANPATGEYHWDTESSNAEYNNATGVFEITIENKKGSQLPETGGIGTYVFYIVGAAIMAVSAGLLITRRKKA